ncbi:MAG: hypothetical protein IPM71_01945 [Bacteroidota bacterium]|nr:MAG: hypothetical protein IPM71_01945 [Bacteroidota bacterium]
MKISKLILTLSFALFTLAFFACKQAPEQTSSLDSELVISKGMQTDKCGEAKCGEAKCGEAKCGEGAAEKDTTAKCEKAATTEEPAAEAKCGDASKEAESTDKCGE